jgi:hypothetical protein
MRKKYSFILIAFVSIYLWNIIFAFACHSENIDKHTFNAMLQGRFNPRKELSLKISNSQHNIPLPNGSGELNENEYLIPTPSWKRYKNSIIKTEWNDFEQIGTMIIVKNKIGDKFFISIRPFTGAYMILKYYSMNN